VSFSSSDLDLVAARLEIDDTFFRSCQVAIRRKVGDEALLSLMNFAAEHGYKVTFQDASRARRRALDVEMGRLRALRDIVASFRKRDPSLRAFFQHW